MNRRKNNRAGNPSRSPGRATQTGPTTSVSARLTRFGIAWLRAKNPVVRFVLAFGLLAGLFYLAMLSAPFRNTFFPWYLDFTAHVASPVCNWFGQHTTAAGTVITSGQHSIQIARGCDAIEPLALFVAMVMAFPGSIRRKIPGIVLGAFILVSVNLIRIVSLFLTAVYFPGAFEMMHLEVWQSTFVLLTIVLWALWIQWAMKPRPAVSRVSN